MSNSSRVNGARLFVSILIVAGVIAGGIWLARTPRQTLPSAAVQPVALDSKVDQPKSSSGIAPVAAPSIKPTPTVVTARTKTFDSFRLRPFTVAKISGKNAWTAENGRSPDVIRQLAHNELEAERMLGENSTIKRRQLVYRDEPIGTTIQRARSAGETVRDFILPALDGQQYDVEVVQNNTEPVITAGSLVGHLKGRPNSIASIGFKDGYESFNIISPEDGLYIVADAREPGEVMVKEIIPGVYAAPSKISREPDYILTK